MKNTLLLLFALFSLSGFGQTKGQRVQIEPINFSKVKITDSFWEPRLKNHAASILSTCISQIESQTGRIANFVNAGKRSGKHSGIFYDDSDVYKALEGIAYTLINNPDPKLEKTADDWIDKIASAQLKDGYINTYYTLTGLDKRWTNMDKHEDYCAGHLIEAGVAYYQATGKTKLLGVSEKMIKHMMSIFGEGKRHWVPGHEEIELALVKLYNVTNNKRYLDFSKWLLEERGHEYGTTGGNGKWDVKYYQDVKPVEDLTDVSGHSVRAMYLFSGMADVQKMDEKAKYSKALNSLWDDVVSRNMYVTGGVGSSRENEGFTEDYDLPNQTAYCETCASVGMCYWNSRMNQSSGDSKYIDVLERSMYNAVLSGVSLSGTEFFYVNPLESKGDHHRKAWYGTACCPSQISRFMPSIGNYIYGQSDNAIWVNLYIGSTVNISIGKNNLELQEETNYPWNGDVKLIVKSLTFPLEKEIRFRIPAWCKKYSLSLNGKKINNPIVENGYAVLKKEWRKGDEIKISMDMPVEVVKADDRVKADIGKRAIQRGPLVYCMEEVDNKSNFDLETISKNTKFETTFNPSLLGGIMEIKTVADPKNVIKFIPYYSWDNRAESKMKVWIDYKE
ncbi:glycoside hydrolase family 127 protein [Pedobacter borealis]|uniref:glycoside hydrolase family 127 protein n=1 Tax=Pedobacter borealis TaxID=475254 RepID=UPI000493AF60|nr:beta-L-arabinofuranosidase domain-containing protein [Pedobacter borealis]